MPSAHWSEVRRIVEEALEIPAPERARWLDSTCSGRRELREEVDGLLAAEAAAERLAGSPVAGVLEDALPAGADGLAPGVRVGAYELVRVVASGGMGIVYEARQLSPQRKVALKVMRESLATAEARSRFRYEADVLARLQHPNIAQVYESGVQVEGGRGSRREIPFFALEYVEGERNLLEHANDRRLSIADRLRLFLQVCDAVHHGHQKGVIHRDLKPSNLLVTPQGQVKVIDFGVARAIEKRGAERTLLTISGQLVGTLSYMSPEQFGADPSAVDTRSDVYALGTVLYELLLGRLPLDLEGKPLHEISRIVALERPRNPRSVLPSLRPEIEWILLKALEKEPAQRYASASELALDVGRFLANQPVLAGAPSVIHRFKLAIRRNRMASAIGAGATIVLLASTAMYLRSISESRARERRQMYAAMISAADAALRVNDVAGARSFLERAPAELRDWEWNHLQVRQDESVRSWSGKGSLVAFRPGRDTLVTATERRIFEWQDGLEREPKVLLERDDGWITATMAWSPDGSVLALGSHAGGLRLYTAGERIELAVETTFPEKLYDIAFSHDGALLAAGGQNATIAVLDARTARELAVLRGHRAEVSRMIFDRSGERIYSGGNDGTVRAWDWRNGTHRVLAEFRDDVTALESSGDDRRLFAASLDRSLRILDASSGAELARVEGLGSEVVAIAPARRSALLWCALEAGGVEAFEANDGSRVRGWITEPLRGVAVSADDGAVMTASERNEVKQWDPSAAASMTKLDVHWGDVSAACDPRNRWIVTVGGRDGLVCVWDARNDELMRVRLELSLGSGVQSLSADGDWLATGEGGSGEITVWSTRDFTVHWRVPGSRERLERGGWRAMFEGSRVLVRSTDRLERWAIGAEAAESSTTAALPAGTCIAVDGRGELIALGGADGSVVMLRSSDLGRVWAARVHASDVMDLSFSPDGRTLASVGKDNALVLLDARSGDREQRALVEGVHEGYELCSVRFHPAGSRLALGSASGLVRLVDTRTLEPVITFDCGTWVGVGFTSDGDALYVATPVEGVILWRGGRGRARDPIDPQPIAVPRADDHFAAMRARRPDLETTLADIASDASLEPSLKEALLRRAHRERATKTEVLRNALAVLANDDRDPFRLQRALTHARAVRYIENTDPDALLAQALGRIRDASLGADRWEFALSGLERAEFAALERGDRVWAAARAGQAIALAHLERFDEGRVRWEEARRCARFEPEWSALLDEAERLLSPRTTPPAAPSDE